MAIQCELGLLSKRWVGVGAADSRSPGAHWPFVRIKDKGLQLLRFNGK